MLCLVRIFRKCFFFLYDYLHFLWGNSAQKIFFLQNGGTNTNSRSAYLLKETKVWILYGQMGCHEDNSSIQKDVKQSELLYLAKKILPDINSSELRVGHRVFFQNIVMNCFEISLSKCEVKCGLVNYAPQCLFSQLRRVMIRKREANFSDFCFFTFSFMFFTFFLLFAFALIFANHFLQLRLHSWAPKLLKAPEIRAGNSKRLESNLRARPGVRKPQMGDLERRGGGGVVDLKIRPAERNHDSVRMWMRFELIRRNLWRKWCKGKVTQSW